MKRRLKKMLWVLAISIVLSELLLRLLGFKPGYWGKFEGFYPVDSLVMAKNFVTDEYGIYKFGPWVTDSLKDEKHFNWRTTSLVSDAAMQALQITDNITYVHATFEKLKQQGQADFTWITRLLYRIMHKGDEDWDTEFTRAYTRVLQKEAPHGLEKAILNYVSSPFNKEGFRSIEFKVHDTTKVRILLIGDSFAYGMSCAPYFNSYADILLARGYEVYNTGIPGVDPAQYVAIAKKYVPLLKPDLVILNFFEGNDLMRFPRTADQDKPHEHPTNAGIFSSYPLGKYLGPQDAYDYYMQLTAIPEQKQCKLNKVCASTAFTSLVWGGMYKHNFLQHPLLEQYHQFNSNEHPKQIAMTLPYLRAMDSVSQVNHVPLLNIVIPDISGKHNEGNRNINIYLEAADQLFPQQYYHPENQLTLQDFKGSGYHFNNKGALKFADFIEMIIQENYNKK